MEAVCEEDDRGNNSDALPQKQLHIVLVVEESAAKEDNQKLGYVAKCSENDHCEHILFRLAELFMFPISDALEDVLVAHVVNDRERDDL